MFADAFFSLFWFEIFWIFGNDLSCFTVEIEKIYIKMMRCLVICFSVLISFSIIIILFPDRVLDGSMKVLKSHNTLSFLANILDFEERKAGKVSRCENFEKEVTKGYWKAKAGVTQKDVMERRKMDERIRVEMKWPARLHRNDSRCGKQYPIPGYRIQSLCDPDGENPCCNAGTGECGISVAHCNCSQCTDLREMKSADLMEWQTDKPECGIKNFSKNEVCDFLNKYNFKITFMGDSLIRHMITTMLLLITGDPQSGAIPANANKELYKICSGEFLYTNKDCSLYKTAHSSNELSPGAVCAGKRNFTINSAQMYMNGITEEAKNKTRELIGRENSYIVLGVGLHFFLRDDAVRNDVINVLLKIIKDGGGTWPKIIWIEIHNVDGFLRMDTKFHNDKIESFNKKINEFFEERNISVVRTFDMSKYLKSYDGRHYGMAFNFYKTQLLLNHLERKYEKF